MLSGSVLGIDVGWSLKRRSSAACLLEWSDDKIFWQIKRFRAIETEYLPLLNELTMGKQLLSAAFDGPLCRGLQAIGRYRKAEKLLTCKLQQIGKPGQSNSPNGIKLNEQANKYAKAVLAACTLSPATHQHKIHDHAIVEAFPTSFLGLMVGSPRDIPIRRKAKSDVYFDHLAGNGTISNLLGYLLPGHIHEQAITQIRNHDDRAALVCAITALAVTVGKYSAVGDDNGWIILPPQPFITPWAKDILLKNDCELGSNGCYWS